MKEQTTLGSEGNDREAQGRINGLMKPTDEKMTIPQTKRATDTSKKRGNHRFLHC